MDEKCDCFFCQMSEEDKAESVEQAASAIVDSVLKGEAPEIMRIVSFPLAVNNGEQTFQFRVEAVHEAKLNIPSGEVLNANMKSFFDDARKVLLEGREMVGRISGEIDLKERTIKFDEPEKES